MLGVSERRACRVLGQHRSTQRHMPRGREDEERLVEDMIELARQYGRYDEMRQAPVDYLEFELLKEDFSPYLLEHFS